MMDVKPHVLSSRQRGSTTTTSTITYLATGATLLVFALLFLVPNRYQLQTRALCNSLTGVSTSHARHAPVWSDTSQRCPFPIVYNKPHKTAGTKIQNDIVKWASDNDWTAVTCSPFEPNLQMHECVPHDLSGCVIVANHMVLNDAMERLFRRKLGPNVRYMTSTRQGRERRLSHYLQVHRIQHDMASLQDLKTYLRRTNPWSDFFYNTGIFRRTPCPLTWDDKQVITEMASRYDIVIDADLPTESNAILNHFNLFQLSDEFVNVKGASKLQLDDEAEELLTNASCVDAEMHRQLRVRMGSLYQLATGTPCNNPGKGATPCF